MGLISQWGTVPNETYFVDDDELILMHINSLTICPRD